MSKNEKNSDAGHFYLDTVLKSKGMEAQNFMHSASFTINIYRINSKKLMEAIKYTENATIMLNYFKLENEELNNQIHREINRLVHNYLCSVSTFADHMRVKMEQSYMGTDFYKKYKIAVKDSFVDNNHARFVRELRNYLTHKGLPDSSLNLRADNTGEITEDGGVLADFNTGVEYGKEKFLEWDGWTRNSKIWLLAQEIKIPLRSIFEPHTDTMEGFIDWFEFAFSEHHKTDFTEFSDLIKKYKDMDENDKKKYGGMPNIDEII